MATLETLDRSTEQQAERGAANSYHFVTRWRVQGCVEEVAEILNDVSALPRWWPSVYLDVHLLEEGDPDGVGRVVDLWTKGCLPNTLRWRFTTAAKRGTEGLSLTAEGDFRGIGTWTFTQDGDWVDAQYDWCITGAAGARGYQRPTRLRAYAPARLRGALRPSPCAGYRGTASVPFAGADVGVRSLP